MHQSSLTNTQVINFDNHPVRSYVRFLDLSEWRTFSRRNPRLFDAANKQEIANRIRTNGILDPLSGHRISGEQIEIGGPDYHNRIAAKGLISRNRATILMLDRLCGALHRRDHFRLYAAEGITNFARRLRETFPLFAGSEYAPDPESQRRIHPIPHQDLTALTYETAEFDAVVTQDVLEHVPSIDTALREMARVLVPGGWSINSHPFASLSSLSTRKAKIENGEIVHLTEPEYHGNPMDAKGSLVFEVPAWDILYRARSAGFTHAEAWFILDEEVGVMADTGGLFLTCFRR